MNLEPISSGPIETPIGDFVLAASDAGLTHCASSGDPRLPRSGPASEPARRHLEAGHEALCAYFEGEPDPWDELVLTPSGSDFQLRVWAALREIPFGATLSYVGLARAIGSPRAARAVGQANHHNPLGVIIPCHRVVAADGSLGGYGGGLDRKRWLLRHEGVLPRELFDTAPPTSAAAAAR